MVYTMLDRIPVQEVYRYYHHMIRRSYRTHSRWVRILMYPTPNKQYGYLRRWYEDTAPVEFEGSRFPGICDADGYLRFKFGDYWKLPPKEERKIHPVSGFALPEAIKAQMRREDGR